MKHLLPFLISLTFVAISCNNNQTNKSQHATATHTNTDREFEDRIFRRLTFEKFINTEDSIIDNGESAYLLASEIIIDDKEKEKGDYKSWYRENVAHIDSLSRYCIELSDNGEEEELLAVIRPELGNFQSHPIATSDVCFDLNLIMTGLYYSQADKYPDYLQRCIGLWELNRAQINAVQSSSQQQHPLYIEVLKILSGLYEKTGNAEKVAEMEAMITRLSAL